MYWRVLSGFMTYPVRTLRTRTGCCALWAWKSVAHDVSRKSTVGFIDACCRWDWPLVSGAVLQAGRASITDNNTKYRMLFPWVESYLAVRSMRSSARMPNRKSAGSTFCLTPLDTLPNVDREGLPNSRAPRCVAHESLRQPKAEDQRPRAAGTGASRRQGGLPLGRSHFLDRFLDQLNARGHVPDMSGRVDDSPNAVSPGLIRRRQ